MLHLLYKIHESIARVHPYESQTGNVVAPILNSKIRISNKIIQSRKGQEKFVNGLHEIFVGRGLF